MKAKLLQMRTSTLLMILILLFTAGWSHGVQAQEPFNCGSAIV
ncbi:MAG: hypothetical protein RBS53_09255 [Bacteroidales bacterium]|jgi:hypothetical protein|nr:hypothetical protein [Bacteroidales bacterium]